MSLAFLDLAANGIPFWASVLLIVLSFFGSAITATFGIGGGLIMITAMSIFLPAPAVVPVHGAILVGSNASRAFLLSKYLRWDILGWFFIGAFLGGLVGSQLAVGMPAWGLRLAIGGFILFSQWGPKFKGFGEVGPKSFFAAGALGTVLTLFVGASGPVMTTILAQANLLRQQLIATVGACMVVQHGAKIAVFTFAGFVWAPWAGLILLCLVTGFAGSKLGTVFLQRIDEVVFRKGLKYALTLMAVYLVLLAFHDILI